LLPGIETDPGGIYTVRQLPIGAAVGPARFAAKGFEFQFNEGEQ
jgi:hypothetical protein